MSAKTVSQNWPQAEADTFHLFDLIKDYIALIGAIREALNERNKAFQAAQHAQVQGPHF
jgi:hypothetical protein